MKKLTQIVLQVVVSLKMAFFEVAIVVHETPNFYFVQYVPDEILTSHNYYYRAIYFDMSYFLNVPLKKICLYLIYK